VAEWTSSPRFKYKASQLGLYLQGALGLNTALNNENALELTGADDDKVRFAVAIEDGAFTAGGLGDAFASFDFSDGLTGDLGKAGFGSLEVTYAPAPTSSNESALKAIGAIDGTPDASKLKYIGGFTYVRFSDTNRSGDGKGNLKLTGEGLFAGHI
jgi:hypothetical protein